MNTLRVFLKSKWSKRILAAILAFIVLLGAFKLGETVGFRRAEFSYKWGQRYMDNFGPRTMGPRTGMMRPQFEQEPFLMGHGIAGPIISIASSTLVIQDRDQVEKVITVNSDTRIMKFRDEVSISDVRVGDMAVIIGSPDSNGEISAKVIRILPALPTDATTTK